MCRLFGFRSAVLSRAHRSLFVAENALSVQARLHPDGWGMAYFHGGEPYLIKSEAGAADSQSFRRASERLASHTLLVHVRRATVGEVNPFNTHPFRHGRWVFAHNGTVHGFDLVRPRLVADMPQALADRVLGTTDSEALFHWLLSRLLIARFDPFGAGPVDVGAVSQVLARAQRSLVQVCEEVGAPRPIVNFLLTNGDVFFAQRFGRELHFATQKLTCGDAERCAWPDRICLGAERPDGRLNHLLVASERIGDEDRWEEVTEGSILAVGTDWRLRMTAIEA